MNPTDRLMALKKKIEQAKSEKDRAEGRLEGLYDDLAKLGCKTLEDANKKMDELTTQIDRKEKSLTRELSHLEEAYDW